MENTMTKTRKITISAIVIALYVVIMVITQSFAFGAIQVRLATSLYSLSYIFPFLALPLGLANVLSNMLLGGLGISDIIGGGLVGIITALLVYAVRKYKLNIYFTILPIIFIPGLIVPIWLSMLLNVPYSALAISLCLGQVIPAILGLFLINALKNKIGE